MSPKPKPPKGPHTHTCGRCTHTWTCAQSPCKIIGPSNDYPDNPLCGLCYHLEMADRYAAVQLGP